MSKTTAKKPKMTAKQRQQQKVIITGVLVVLLIVLIGVVALVSCGAKYTDVTTSTVFVLKDGKVITTDIEAFDESVYSEDDLKSYVKEVIDTYNKENGKNSVRQKSLKVEDGVATLVLEYANESIYEDFTGNEIFVGTVGEAVEAGYDFNVAFANVTDGIKECTSEEILSNSDLKVVIVKSNTTVSVDGKICYISAVNTSSYTENTVTIKENCNIFDSVTPQDTQTEGSETEGTEEIPEGSVGEDELLSGTEEDKEVIFDFGEEEGGSQYSDVYTIIIFK